MSDLCLKVVALCLAWRSSLEEHRRAPVDQGGNSSSASDDDSESEAMINEAEDCNQGEGLAAA